MSATLDDLSSALSQRLRDLVRLADRLDRLESGTGEWLKSQPDEDWMAASTEMTLRALRVASDPTNYAILAFLLKRTTAPIADLEQAVHLNRLALTERINDLIQVGLAARNIDTDQVQGTAAGAALVEWINHISEATANRLGEALQLSKQ
jgi:DNA-binding HxlR family transcriptional regulator